VGQSRIPRVITTAFVNLAMNTAILRDNGVLKRVKGTPLPRWAYFTARIGSTCLVTLIITVTVIAGGVAIWGLHFGAGALPGLVVTMILGTAAFTALGIGLTRLIPNAESGPVVVNLLILPLTFISNIWFPTDSLPAALKSIAGVFPIRALANGLQFVFDPRRHGAGLDGSSLRVLAFWTVIGVLMMIKFLRQPQGEVA
jgi:ABC-2 type transport system permease protein